MSYQCLPSDSPKVGDAVLMPVFLPPTKQVMQELQKMKILIPVALQDTWRTHKYERHFETSRICEVIKLKYLQSVKRHVSLGANLSSVFHAQHALTQRGTLIQTIQALKELLQHVPTSTQSTTEAWKTQLVDLCLRLNNTRDMVLHRKKIESTIPLPMDTSIDAVSSSTMAECRALLSFMLYATMRINEPTKDTEDRDDAVGAWLSQEPSKPFMEKTLYWSDIDTAMTELAGKSHGPAVHIHPEWCNEAAPFGAIVCWWYCKCHARVEYRLEKEGLIMDTYREMLVGTIAELETVYETATAMQVKMLGSLATAMFTLISFIFQHFASPFGRD